MTDRENSAREYAEKRGYVDGSLGFRQIITAYVEGQRIGEARMRGVVEGALLEADRYINWYADDLCGDDCVGDGKRTTSWKRTLGIIDFAIAELRELDK